MTSKAPRLGPGLSLLVSLGGSDTPILQRWLNRAGHDVRLAEDLAGALSMLERSTPDLMLLDAGIPDAELMDWLRGVRLRYPSLAVLVSSESSNLDHAVASMQAGSFDYLVKPVEEVRLITAARNGMAFHRLSTRVVSLEREARGEGYSGIVGRSAPMRRLFRQIDRLAGSDVTILIHGESGSGKELVARAIHEHSSRSGAPFVAVNCAAIPETLQESELFGHEKGAFTGATERRAGRFEQANGGTLFFDEVGELSPGLQAKLLRVLQERRFNRVGGVDEIEVDVRVLCATHRVLEDDVAAGRFRQDLFYRLAVIELEVPPLREREGDIPLLAQTILETYDESQGHAGAPRSLDIPVLHTFLQYPWPGNVRELQNAVQRAAVLSEGEVLAVKDLPRGLREFAEKVEADGGVQLAVPTAPHRSDADQSPRDPETSLDSGPPLLAGGGVVVSAPAQAVPRPFVPAGMTLKEVEAFAVREAYRRARGNVSAAARELGVSRSVLYRKLDRFGIQDSEG